MAPKRPSKVVRLPEKVVLSAKEEDAVQRLAKRKGLPPETVIQVLAAAVTDWVRVK